MTTVHKCDKCGNIFEPKEGFGFIKLQFIDPKHPLVENNITKPNVREIRFDELCLSCTSVLFSVIESYENKE